MEKIYKKKGRIFIFSTREAIKFGWGKFVEKVGFWVVLMLLYFVIIFGVDFWSLLVRDLPVSFLFDLISMALSLIFSLGMIKITLKAYENEAYSYSDFLNVFKYLIRYIISFIIYLAVVLIVTLIVVMPFILFATSLAFDTLYRITDGTQPLIVGFLVIMGLPGMIPGILLAIKLFFFDYFIVDKDMGIIESLKASFRLTKGRLLKLIVFFLAVVLINFGGILLLGIGLLVTMPISFLATAHVYKKLVERESTEFA
ncbi:DUF975 family protein [Natranaerofaba carboxydovora]|uniref:DUF975 family protein n=1 Tax=Natranaerofaba carboxydovora TaxID=2742683 RepID=UPI001F13BB1B|nr:DUF975 family protein [Natranaerofaba carboxydovora]UMZ74414.1 hypothetical protein ACONDI_02005 [Natranaerofaba carboxydovora]